jgi:hypothetical protein
MLERIHVLVIENVQPVKFEEQLKLKSFSVICYHPPVLSCKLLEGLAVHGFDNISGHVLATDRIDALTKTVLCYSYGTLMTVNSVN